MIKAILLTLSGEALVLWAANSGPLPALFLGIAWVIVGSLKWRQVWIEMDEIKRMENL